MDEHVLSRHVVRHLEPQYDVCTRMKVSRRSLAWGCSVHKEGRPAHKINLCKKCYNETQQRQREQISETRTVERVDGAKSFSWKVMGCLWCGAISTKNVGAPNSQKSMGQSSPDGCGKRRARKNTKQLAKGSHLPKSSSNWSSVAVI